MRAPKFPTLFKQARNEPRRFTYSPRIYDERKERLEKRMKEIEAEMKYEQKLQSDNEAKERASETDNYLRFQRRRQTRQSNMRLMIILAALLFGTYLMLSRLDLLSQAESLF